MHKSRESIDKQQAAQMGYDQLVSSRYRVNVLHGGKERWKYCRTIERAKRLQESAKSGGLCSIIYQKTTDGYVVCGL